nr:immunoglobulin light chain junction region [Macaca mulatta]
DYYCTLYMGSDIVLF